MVLQTDRYVGGYHQENYSAHQGPNGYYSNFQEMTEENLNPYSPYNQISTFRPHSNNIAYQQTGFPVGVDHQYHHGNGGSHYHGGGFVPPVKPYTGGYGNPYYDEKPGYGYGTAPDHHQHHGYGQSHGHGNGSYNSHGYGSQFEKTKYGHQVYGNGGQKYGHTHSASGINYGYEKPSWTLKGLDDDEE